MLTPDTLGHYHDFARGLARECGFIARRHFSLDMAVQTKSDNTPVTEADLEINRLVVERCRQAFPGVGVIGEEESLPGETNLTWVCDPIDGTGPYTFGMSASTFCLALVEDGVPVIGIIYDFMHERMYHAIRGGGAFINDLPFSVPVDVSPMPRVNLEWWRNAVVQTKDLHEAFFERGYQVPNYTSSGYMGMQVAQGRLAGQVYMGSCVWDVAALKVVADEAGLRTGDIDGKEQRYDGDVRGLICAHPRHYEVILDVITEAHSASGQPGGR